MPNVYPQDDGIRSAGAPDECFYCGQKVGTPHLEKCVALKKTVRLRFIVEAEGEYPYSWTNKQIEKHEYYEGMILNLPPSKPDPMLSVIRCQVIGTIEPGPNITIRPPPILPYKDDPR